MLRFGPQVVLRLSPTRPGQWSGRSFVGRKVTARVGRQRRCAPVARRLLRGETSVAFQCTKRATMRAAPFYWTFPTCEMELVDPAPLTAAYGRAACQRRFIMKADS